MNKRIITIVLALVMVVCMMAAAIPVSAAGTFYFKVTADKTEACPGEIITYTVSMGPVDYLINAEFKLDIPAGMTYVADSGKAVDGCVEALGAIGANFSEETKEFIVWFNPVDSYSGTSETPLMTFQCTFDADATGDKEVGLIIDPSDVYDDFYSDIPFTTEAATVSVGEHDWADADCTNPATCTLCGATDGEALGHDWVGPTCTDVKTCDVCGATEGDVLDHNWSDELSSDETGHWAVCADCGAEDEADEHADEDADGLCDACGYELPQDNSPATGDMMLSVAISLMAASACAAVIISKKRND